jgi:hypothetical protein
MSAQRISLYVLMVGVALLLGLNVASASPVPTAGWSFDSNFTATVGGSSYDLTNHSAVINTTCSKWGGGSVHMTASGNQYATGLSPFAANGTNSDDTYTYSAWYYLDDTALPSGTTRLLFQCTNSTNFDYPEAFQVVNTAGTPNSEMYTENSGAYWVGGYAQPTPPVYNKTWTNVIGTSYYSGGTTHISLYINGVSVAGSNLPGHIAPSSIINMGAKRTPGALTCWNGYIDDFAVWNSVLSAGDIADLQNHSAFVPEPGTVVLLVTGLFGLLAYAWRKRK